MDAVDIETQSQISLLCQDDYFKSTTKYWNCLRKELKKIGVTPTEKAVVSKPTLQSQERQAEQTVLKSKPDISGLNKINTAIANAYYGKVKVWGAELLGVLDMVKSQNLRMQNYPTSTRLMQKQRNNPRLLQWIHKIWYRKFLHLVWDPVSLLGLLNWSLSVEKGVILRCSK